MKNQKKMKTITQSNKVSKAIRLWIRDNAKLTLEQKRLLDIFIETNYKDTNYCLK